MRLANMTSRSLNSLNKWDIKRPFVDYGLQSAGKTWSPIARAAPKFLIGSKSSVFGPLLEEQTRAT